MTSNYLVILFVGVLVVLLDGQLILRKSPSYLAEVYHSANEAKQTAGMVAVLFHLVMLGLVFLIAGAGISPDAGPRTMIARIGIVLLLTALAHGAVMLVLSRLREQRLSSELAEAEAEASHHPRPRR